MIRKYTLKKNGVNEKVRRRPSIVTEFLSLTVTYSSDSESLTEFHLGLLRIVSSAAGMKDVEIREGNQWYFQHASAKDWVQISHDDKHVDLDSGLRKVLTELMTSACSLKILGPTGVASVVISHEEEEYEAE